MMYSLISGSLRTERLPPSPPFLPRSLPDSLIHSLPPSLTQLKPSRGLSPGVLEAAQHFLQPHDKAATGKTVVSAPCRTFRLPARRGACPSLRFAVLATKARASNSNTANHSLRQAEHNVHRSFNPCLTKASNVSIHCKTVRFCTRLVILSQCFLIMSASICTPHCRIHDMAHKCT